MLQFGIHVPKIRKNWIYGALLKKCGYKQVYEFDKYILSKCGAFVGFVYHSNGMFMLNLNKSIAHSIYMSLLRNCCIFYLACMFKTPSLKTNVSNV